MNGWSKSGRQSLRVRAEYMSGICGLVGAPTPIASRDRLAAMMQCLAHRGPDAQRSWCDRSVALGHLMLRSTTESLHEELPWQHSASRHVITVDARIDNRQELLGALGIRLESDCITPDSQIILLAYLKWGKACLERLLGDFAFAIWDPSEQTLFCARDHLGIRPFYYCLDSERFVFASSAVAVANGLDQPARLNERRVADYLLMEMEGIDQTVTFYKDIHRLPPACQSTYCRGQLSINNYWNTETLTELKLGSDLDYQDALREVFNSSVMRSLRSQHPVASMLSGGIDSSVIVGTAAKLHSDGRTTGTGFLSRTVSQISDDEAGDSESACIRAVVERCGVPAVLLRSDIVEEKAQQLGSWLHDLEDPFDCIMTQRYIMYLTAAGHGHRVLLDGVDGDLIASLPAGYPAFLAIKGQVWTALREAAGQWVNYHNRTVPLWRSIVPVLWPLLSNRSLRKTRRRRARERDFSSVLRSHYVRPEFARAVGLHERYQRYHFALDRCGLDYNLKSGLRAAHVERVRVPYLTAGIERYERVAASCGIEARHPLLDKQFVEFCIRMPQAQLCRDGWEKYGLRRLASEVVPGQVAWRRDGGGLDWQYVSKWMTANRQDMIDRLVSDYEVLSDWIDWPEFSRQLQRYIIDGNESIDCQLRRLYCLQAWVKSHF